jgi:hypothetical protein
MHPRWRNDASQRAMQITAVERIVWRAKTGLDGFPQRRAQQQPTVVPAPLIECRWLYTGSLQLVGNPQSIENA